MSEVVLNIYIWLFLLIVSLVVLVNAASYFNKAAESIGLSFGMSPFVIGVLITAIGTSLPELITSILAVIQGASDIVPGNVAGSNIANIFLVIGLVAVIYRKPIKLESIQVTVDLQFLMGSSLFIALAFWDGVFSLFEGILCLIGFAVYFHYLMGSLKRADRQDEEHDLHKASWKDYLWFFLAGGLIYAAAYVTVQSVVHTAQYFEVASSVVAAGVLALGTSLPELVVSLDAIRKGKSEYALGNILGSSIFNCFWVMGIASLFGAIIVTEEVTTLIMPVMLIASFLFYMFTRDKQIAWWEGALFLLFYVLFISKLAGETVLAELFQ
jgi:cation:H+ antiporter